MLKYFAKRILLIFPTLLGISIACFFVNSIAPGGPLEQKISQIRFAGGMDGGGSGGEYGVSQEVIEALKKQYGFDKPIPVQYLIWLKNILTLNFGESFSTEEPVIDMIAERIPVSLQFGLISLILTYIVCVVLGLRMAVRNGEAFDTAASVVLLILYSIPPLMLGILLKVFLAGGAWLDWFPLGDLYSDMYFEKGFPGRALDRIHHFILPLICYMAGAFTVLTQLMKNSLLEEIGQDYARTAKAKGLSEMAVIYRHTLRNALIPIATSLGNILGVFLTGSLIIEKIFSINGIGLLAFDSAISRDYNVLMALIVIQSFLFLAGRILSDAVYMAVDPRIDFK